MERYLPLLENLVKCVEEEKDNPKIVQWTTDLGIRWTSPLSGSNGRLFTGSKYFRVDDLRYELGMTFFLYGALLRELAVEVLSTGMWDLFLYCVYFRITIVLYAFLCRVLNNITYFCTCLRVCTVKQIFCILQTLWRPGHFSEERQAYTST